MNSDDAGFDRRRFLQLMGLGLSSAALALPANALAQARPGTPSAAPADSAAKANAPPPIGEDARSLAEIVRRRYGQHLTPDQLEAVTRELDQRVQTGKRLRDLKFANGDEPDFVFHA